jgi:hypothetical protein
MMHTITARSIRRSLERDGKREPRGSRLPKPFEEAGFVSYYHPTKGWRSRRVPTRPSLWLAWPGQRVKRKPLTDTQMGNFAVARAVRGMLESIRRKGHEGS